MSVAYSFTESQVKDLEKSRAVFNRFTGQKLTLQQFIHSLVTETINANLDASAKAERLMQDISLDVGKFKAPKKALAQQVH